MIYMLLIFLIIICRKTVKKFNVEKPYGPLKSKVTLKYARLSCQ